MRHALFASLRLLIALFFLIGGALLMALVTSRTLQEKALLLLQRSGHIIALFGFLLFLSGLISFVYVLLNLKGRHYQIRSGRYTALVDEGVVDSYVTDYIRRAFPKMEVYHDTAIKGGKIHLSIDLPHYPDDEQRRLVEKIEKELGHTFQKFLGYPSDFFLSASFRQAPQ
jgi:hypothetical protein